MKIQNALLLSNSEYEKMCHSSRERANLLLSETLFLSKYENIIKND